MKTISLIAGIVLLAGLAAVVGYRLNPEAAAMAVGIVFGMVAGVPATLLAMAGSRRRAIDDDEMPDRAEAYDPPAPTAVPVGTPPVVYQYMREHGGTVIKDVDGALIYFSRYGARFPLATTSFEEEVW